MNRSFGPPSRGVVARPGTPPARGRSRRAGRSRGARPRRNPPCGRHTRPCLRDRRGVAWPASGAGGGVRRWRGDRVRRICGDSAYSARHRGRGPRLPRSRRFRGEAAPKPLADIASVDGEEDETPVVALQEVRGVPSVNDGIPDCAENRTRGNGKEPDRKRRKTQAGRRIEFCSHHFSSIVSAAPAKDLQLSR